MKISKVFHLDLLINFVVLTRINAIFDFGPETQRTPKISINNDIFKVYKLFCGLSSQSLLLGYNHHSKSLPNTPHYDQKFLSCLFETPNTATFRKKSHQEDDVADDNHNTIKDIPEAYFLS